MVILENIDIDMDIHENIDIDKGYIDIDKILYRFEFGISNNAIQRCVKTILVGCVHILISNCVSLHLSESPIYFSLIFSDQDNFRDF